MRKRSGSLSIMRTGVCRRAHCKIQRHEKCPGAGHASHLLTWIVPAGATSYDLDGAQNAASDASKMHNATSKLAAVRISGIRGISLASGSINKG